MPISRRQIFRLGSIAVLAVGAVFPPRQASAAMTPQCHVCTYTGHCPVDITFYDSACVQTCGWGTYAGACWIDVTEEFYTCGLGNAAVVCYYMT